ncbi:ribonuclease H1-like [Phlebotomus argentipes]|uniref:ribonuclease H1-like n=1 Tax=Phlebotomus argentipes TaxID=94469 RepID=UPI002892D6F0|nr:ribonuclease H1-like [Phlebotomus argentipes]
MSRGRFNYVDVWTDGSCPGNGPNASRGGIGVFWDDDHPWNVSQRARGRTNNSCEIEAATVALQIAKDENIDKLRINTDSEFLINCVLKWMPIWRNNGWINASGNPVRNRHELMELDDELDESIRVYWNHVPGHKGNYGNRMADKLARRGAKNY